MARFAVIIVVLILSAFALPVLADEVAAAPPVTVRFSTGEETVRVVLDLPAEVAFTDQSTPSSIIVMLAQQLAEALPAVTIKDPVVTGITVAPDDAKQAVLTILLAKARKSRVFTLPAKGDKPFRLVVDIFKQFSHEERRMLSPAIQYTRLERQSDDRYFVAHIVSARLKDPKVHLQVVKAQGERETVASMAQRGNAVCGINGSYFLAKTRPVGLLKIDDQVMSLPIWGRTAVAIPRKGMPVFGNPTGTWRVTLPDGSVREMPDWLDASVAEKTPPMRVMSGMTLHQAPATRDGFTAIIRNGKIIARPAEATALEPEDFALILLGDEAKALDAALTVDAAVTIAPRISPDWGEYTWAVGAGPRLLAGGKPKLTGQEERFKPDILTGRAARSGIGTTKNGHIILAVVEAPGPYGGGATLDELATLLKTYGAQDAMNLDGGGSSCLSIGAETVNYPPKSWVRPVASSILIFDERSVKKTAVVRDK